MSTDLNADGGSTSSIWLENLVDGLSGIRMKAKHSVHFEASPFQKIEVFDTYAFGRVLLMGGTIVYTQSDGHIYNEMLTHPALFSHNAPREICIIGGGDGGCLSEALKHVSIKKITIVEIDNQVTSVVNRFFPELSAGLKDKRVQMFFEDGYAWLSQAKSKYDVIVVDSFDPGGPVQSLETANFFEVVRKSLKPGGLAVLHTDAPHLNREKIHRTMRDLSVHFAWCRPYTATIPSFPLGTCSFVLCGTGKAESHTGPRAKMENVSRQCRYFNADIFSGAFCLPKSVGEIFNI
jgi:spermidine synthase